MNTPASAPADSREAILARIREALTNPAVLHENHAAHAPETPPESAIPHWLPPVGPTADEQLALFAQNSADLKTEFKVCSSIDDAVAHLHSLAAENNWSQVATHRGTLTDAIAEKLTTPVYRVDNRFDAIALEACGAGLSECEALIAQTGSICVTSLSSGGRSLSVLPPHHVVIARRDQILPDLPAAYELLKKKYGATGYPSFMSFITGPSRTGDIERILVLGAHGPKKLTVLLVP